MGARLSYLASSAPEDNPVVDPSAATAAAAAAAAAEDTGRSLSAEQAATFEPSWSDQIALAVTADEIKRTCELSLWTPEGAVKSGGGETVRLSGAWGHFVGNAAAAMAKPAYGFANGVVPQQTLQSLAVQRAARGGEARPTLSDCERACCGARQNTEGLAQQLQRFWAGHGPLPWLPFTA